MSRTLNRARRPRGSSFWAPVALATLVAALSACGQADPAERLARANAQYAQGEYRVAAIELRNVLQQEPNNSEARLLFGRVSLMLGDPDTAARELALARELGAEAEDFALPLAQALVGVGSSDEALIELDRVPEQARDAEWFSVRGDIHAAEGRVGPAQEAFQSALDLVPTHYQATLGLARTASQRQAWDEAYEIATRAIDRDPERPEAYLVRATARLGSGNVAAAETDLARAAELWTGPASAPELNNLLLLAQLQLTLRRIDALEATAARARNRLPGNPALHYVEGAVDFARGRYEDANLKLQRALAEMPANAQLLLLLGLNNLALGNLNQAEQHLLALLNERPQDSTGLRLLAETRRRQGQPGDALAALRQIQGADDDSSLLALRGMLHLEAGQLAESIQFLEQALQTVPEAGLRLQLARAYIAANRREDAVALFEGTLGAETQQAVDTAAGLIAQARDVQSLEEARAAALDLVAKTPNDAQTLTGAALFLHALGDEDDARELLSRAASADPAFAASNLILAGLALSDGDTERARGLYQAIVERSPGEFRAWLGLAQIAAAAEARDEARRFARSAAEAAPRALPPQLFLARLALASGESAAARSAVDAALEIDGANPDALTLAGMLALQQGQVDSALAQLQRAAEAEPRRADRWHILGRAQRTAEDLRAAQGSLQRAVELVPGNAAFRSDLARVELGLGNTEAAVRLARGLQTDFPSNPDGYLLEGNILAAAGDHFRAAALFDRAYELGPAFEIAAAAHRARQAGSLADAAAPLRRWLEDNPGDARAWFMLAQFHQSEGQGGDAATAYDRVISLQPAHVVALNNAAWLYNEAGDPRALDYARRAYEQDTQNPSVIDTYGWVLLQRNDVEAALPLLREAVRRAPDGPLEIQYHLARGLIQAGERAEARALLQRLLDRGEEFAYREQAEAELAELR